MTRTASAPRSRSTIVPPRSGSTLVELLVTITVLGIIGAVVVLALPASRMAPRADAQATLATARQQALDSARAITLTIDVGGRAADVTMLPDGSVVADSAIGADRLSGAWFGAPR